MPVNNSNQSPAKGGLMDKKFLISTIVVFVVWMLGGFVVHGFWLGPYYETMPNIMRSLDDQNAYFHWMIIAHVLMAIAFVWIYRRGCEDKPWLQQGLRFGAAIALLAPIPTFMIFYSVQQNPAALALRQAIGDGIVVIILGVIVAFLNRKPA
jgi:hypothetical protein